MSHLVTVQTQIRDPAAVAAACRRLRLPAPIEGVAQLYSGEARGLIVNLPEWQYPVVIDLASGQVHYDNFRGTWGDQIHFSKFMQTYAVEKTRIESHKRGFVVNEQTLEDGSIKLHVSKL